MTDNEDFGRAGVQLWTRNGMVFVLLRASSWVMVHGSGWEHGEPETLEKRYPESLQLSQSIRVLLQSLIAGAVNKMCLLFP